MIRLLLALLVCVAVPAGAQQVTPAPGLEQRAGELPALMRGGIAYDAYFAPAFVAAVPQARFDAIVAQVVAANGAPTGVESIVASSPYEATVRLGLERAVATILLVVDPAAPHKVTGWRLTGAQTRGDTPAKLSADFAALKGGRALLVTELGATAPPLLAIDADAAGAVGSAFKLFVLAETTRAVAAGALGWDQVLPLAPDLLSSATMARWPVGMPVTLHSAATAMIATSDNRATDTVMAALDRDWLERESVALGLDRRTLPFLTTRQALALKTRASAPLAARWRDADEAGRRALLRENAAALAEAPIPVADFTGAPRHIDAIEWFASPRALANVLDRLRQRGGAPALDALAVNRGVDPALADRFAYLGYKGGSESGVIAMAYLVRTKAGRWYAVAGWWNDPAKPVEDLTFATLMSRALGLIPAG